MITPQPRVLALTSCSRDSCSNLLKRPTSGPIDDQATQGPRCFLKVVEAHKPFTRPCEGVWNWPGRCRPCDESESARGPTVLCHKNSKNARDQARASRTVTTASPFARTTAAALPCRPPLGAVGDVPHEQTILQSVRGARARRRRTFKEHSLGAGLVVAEILRVVVDASACSTSHISLRIYKSTSSEVRGHCAARRSSC